MRVLLDHCVPQRLAQAFVGHEVVTAGMMQWDRLRNGALLAAAGAAGFDAMVTVDQNLKYEQNLTRLPLAVDVLCAVSNDIDELSKLVPRALDALSALEPRTLIEVTAPAAEM